MNTSDFVFVSKREWACEDVGGWEREREAAPENTSLCPVCQGMVHSIWRNSVLKTLLHFER